VEFISKAASLGRLKKISPQAVKVLPSNPFPDSLTIRPVKGVSALTLGRKIQTSNQPGVDNVDWSASQACGV
jgi:cell division protein FtsX